jgi:hypothetical protein
MLDPSAMTRASLLAVILVAALPSAALAGGYIGLGIGTAPAVNSDKVELVENGRSAKILAGTKLGRFSLEGALHGYDVSSYSAYQLSIAGKFTLPLDDQFGVFGRFGLGKTWLTTENSIYDVDGNGYLLGAGAEYRLDLGVAAGAIWIDYQYNKSQELAGERNKFDFSSRMWMLGISVGI